MSEFIVSIITGVDDSDDNLELVQDAGAYFGGADFPS